MHSSLVAESIHHRRLLRRLRGGMVFWAARKALHLVWSVIKLQLFLMAFSFLWPVPLVVFFYWLMYHWFGCEGTSLIAFTGLR